MGYMPDPYDGRDHLFAQMGLSGKPSKELISLEHFAEEPENQDLTNACTFFAAGEAFEISWRARYGTKSVRSSKMAGYAWGRHQHSHPEFPLVDTGSYCRSAIQGMIRHGICDENVYEWAPWASDEFFFSDGSSKEILRINARPPLKAVRNAFDWKGPRGYTRIRGFGQAVLDQVDLALANGFACIFGTAIDSEVVASTGDHFVYYPREFKLLGHHAMCIIARMYANGRRFYRIQQSYGSGYKDGGRVWLDERYVIEGRDRWIVIP